MKIKSIKKFIAFFGIMFLFECFNIASAENILSSIEVSKMGVGYKVSIGADKPTEVKKIISSDNKMTLEMKDIQISPSVNTIYNNVLEVSNIIIEETSNNSAKITFEGENISNSKIYFQTIEESSSAQKTEEKTLDIENSIELSKPIDEYTPIYSNEVLAELDKEESFVEEAKSSILAILKNKTLRRYIKAGLQKASKHATKENLTYVCLFFTILILGAKVLFPNKKVSSIPQIDLTRNFKDREFDRLESMNVEEKIQENKKKIQNDEQMTNSIYGMKSYKNSLKSPYISSINKPVSTVSSLSGLRKPNYSYNTNSNLKKFKNNQQQVSTNKKVDNNMTKQNIVTKNPIKTNVSNKKINVDSAKFLESMAKIYEKNGRLDLAKGLKDNMKKIQPINR